MVVQQAEVGVLSELELLKQFSGREGFMPVLGTIEIETMDPEKLATIGFITRYAAATLQHLMDEGVR